MSQPLPVTVAAEPSHKRKKENNDDDNDGVYKEPEEGQPKSKVAKTTEACAPSSPKEEERICACQWREDDPQHAPNYCSVLISAAQEGDEDILYHLKGHPEAVEYVLSALREANSEIGREDELASFNFITLFNYVIARRHGKEYQNGEHREGLTWLEGQGNEKGDNGETLNETKLRYYFGISDDLKESYEV